MSLNGADVPAEALKQMCVIDMGPAIAVDGVAQAKVC